MLLHSKIANLLRAGFIGALTCAALIAQSAEVYFDTISTEKATRLHGAYFGAYGGISINPDGDVRSRGQTYENFDDSIGGWGGIEIGYSWQTPIPLRPAVEFELMYLYNELDARGSGGGVFASEEHSIIAMFNFVLALDLEPYRQDIGDFWANLHPYVGAGIGAGYVFNSDLQVRDTPGGRDRQSDQDDLTFAYQIFAGIEYDVTEAFSIYMEYKYLVLDDLGNDIGISDRENHLLGVGFKVQY